MQYIKLKNQRWKNLHSQWLDEVEQIKMREADMATETEEVSRFARLKSLIKPNSNNEEEPEELPRSPLTDSGLPRDKKALKKHFLDNLIHFQMQWATSTVREVSYLEPKYRYDKNLKFLLQRFPDIYFVMYKPVFNIKQAPIDGEIVLISPVGIDVITILESHEDVRYLAGDDRTWMKDTLQTETTFMSPLIGLKRTEHIIKSILNAEGLELPIHKVILSKTNNIVFSSEPYNTSIVGKFQFEEWFKRKRQLTSTLKSEQLKIMEALLNHSLTNASLRPEWQSD